MSAAFPFSYEPMYIILQANPSFLLYTLTFAQGYYVINFTRNAAILLYYKLNGVGMIPTLLNNTYRVNQTLSEPSNYICGLA